MDRNDETRNDALPDNALPNEIANPDRPLVSVFGSSSLTPADDAWHDAERLGQRLAEAGYGVLTGGYSGLMEAVSKGARSVAGAPVVGITAPDVFKQRSGGNPFLTREVGAPHLLERIHLLTERSAASVALPGSIGTLTELMIVWNLASVAPMAGRPVKPIIALGEVWLELIPQLSERLGAEAPIQMTDTVEGVLEHLRYHHHQQHRHHRP
ncbi:MAG: LOG family protein [Trueperaceae bacterium]|nr:LOG family protein [Trueperaceae bacterium]